MLVGNKGEWTEAYVFLRLLAEGKLSADHRLQNVQTTSFPVIKVERKEVVGERHYEIVGENINVTDVASSKIVLTLPKSVFKKEADLLLMRLKNAKGGSFSLPESEAFLNSIDIYSLSAPSADKSDIHLTVYDPKTGQRPTLGFSIKSMIGQKATLFNPGRGTNFIFKIHPPLSGLDIKKINRETYAQAEGNRSLSKITLRLHELLNQNCRIEFFKVQSEKFGLNLTLIETRLSELLGYTLFYRYKNKTPYIGDLLEILTKENPLSYDLSYGHQFYHYRMKRFLTDAALGMTAETVWSGVHDATGGFIIARPNGEVGCYHTYNKNDFETYLITSSKLEQPSTGEDPNNPGFSKKKPKKPFLYGWIYEEGGEYFIKLNLQIRFL